MGKARTELKNRLKVLKNNIPINYNPELSNIEKIKQLESRIKLCKDDLLLFPTNLLIKNKIINMEKQIEELNKNE